VPFGKSLKQRRDISKLLKFPAELSHTLHEEAKNLGTLASGLAEIRNLQRDRLASLAQKMLKRAGMDKEIEVGEVAETEDGFTVRFRFRG
jgi:hypothetical protein